MLTKAQHVLLLHFAGDSKKDDESSKTKNNLPKKIRLRSTLLINLRPTAGIQVIITF